MKRSLIASVLFLAALSGPEISFAQSNQVVTRATVKQELADLRNVGYVPSDDQNQYPRAIQAAEQKLAGGGLTVQNSYGSSDSGRSESSAHVPAITPSLYLHR